MPSLAPPLTIVVLLTGDLLRLREAARQFLFDLSYYAAREAMGSRGVECILVPDGPKWHEALAGFEIARSRVLPASTACHHPGVLLNRALHEVHSPWLCVFGLTTEVSTWVGNIDKWDQLLATSHAVMMAGYRGGVEGRQTTLDTHRVHQSDGFSSDYPHAWLQMLDLVPMSNAMMRTDALRLIGGATEARRMQRMWWWELCLRASYHAPIESHAIDPAPGVDWHTYPFQVPHAAPIDECLRVLMKVESEPGRLSPVRDEECSPTAPPSAPNPMRADATLAAQSPLWRGLDRELRQRTLNIVAAKGRPLKIAVLGGVNEPAHNQLCFFNFFTLMRGWNVANWRAFLDTRAQVEDVADCDLVLFSRVRSAEGEALMRECAARGIATLYMLDDNWFWLGREWHDYANVFAPGAPDYEHFLSCVQQADTTLTYSAPLAEDLAPYAKRLTVLPTNVDMRAFEPRSAVSKHSGHVKIGYVGSLRKNMLAFDALVRVAHTRRDVDVFVMSNALPAEFSTLPPDRVHFEPYQFNYAAYAATVMRAMPDILVAPVGRTRFEASKCPNKYLEISAAGAAGVYSRAEPYLSHIVEYERGLFAGDTVDEWTEAINCLIDNEALRDRIRTAARAHVGQQFDTRAVLPAWLDMLLNAIR
jgi:hypothetical protein